ncbi:MAG: PD-(D/E)XK motif protein [Rhizobiales bacterium]|nr:PD-(D/E)XK motif protein [Hyphomicrobiales bacterium]
MSQVCDAWLALRAEHRREAGWHLRRVHTEASCEISAGIQQPGGIPMLVLELPVADVPSDIVLPQSRGFSVEPRLTGGSSSGMARYAIILSDPAYESVFDVLCSDVAAVAAALSRRADALRSLMRQLHIWQDFMARHGPGGMSDEEIIGLIGELVLIRDHLRPLIGIRAVLNTWAGPDTQPNDFGLPGGFLEVKTTTRQAPTLIPISNAAQLDDLRGTILLAHVHLRPDPGGVTLPELAGAVRSIVRQDAPELVARFDEQLRDAGYLEAQASFYDRRFGLDRVDFYRVTDGFPRLTPADLRPGVDDCRYTIQVRACAPFAVPATYLDSLVGQPGR